MFDSEALHQILSIQSAAWTATAIFMLLAVRLWSGTPAMFQQWIAYRSHQAEAKLADWNRLREEIKRLSEAEERCRRDYGDLYAQHMDMVRRIAELEGYMTGQNKASQEAAEIATLEWRKSNGS